MKYFLIDSDFRLNEFIDALMQKEGIGLIYTNANNRESLGNNNKHKFLIDLNGSEVNNFPNLTSNAINTSDMPSNYEETVFDIIETQRDQFLLITKLNSCLCTAFQTHEILGYITIDESMWMFQYVAKFVKAKNKRVLTIMHGSLSSSHINEFYSDAYCVHNLQQLNTLRCAEVDYYSKIYLLKSNQDYCTNLYNKKMASKKIDFAIGLLESWSDDQSVEKITNKIIEIMLELKHMNPGVILFTKPHPYAPFSHILTRNGLEVVNDLEVFLNRIDLLVCPAQSSAINKAFEFGIGVLIVYDPDIGMPSPYFCEDPVVHVRLPDFAVLIDTILKNPNFFDKYFEDRFPLARLKYSTSFINSKGAVEILLNEFGV